MDFDRCLLLGAGGHSRVVADTLLAINPDADIAMLDGLYPRIVENGGYPVIGNIDRLAELSVRYPTGLAAIGKANDRLALIERLESLGYSVPALIHPASWVSRNVDLGGGTVILAGAIVQTGTRIDRGCILNTGSSVDHDCTLAEGVHIAPGARLAGGVTVYDRAWIGIGSAVKENLSIGSDAVVGAGAAVIHDVSSGQTVAGVPAKPQGSNKL